MQKGVSVVFILAGAWLLTRIARRLLRRLRTYTVRVMDRRGSASTIELENRAATIIAVLGKLASTVIWIVALVMALSQLDFHIEPLLAGLGVAGIAVGLVNIAVVSTFILLGERDLDLTGVLQLWGASLASGAGIGACCSSR